MRSANGVIGRPAETSGVEHETTKSVSTRYATVLGVLNALGASRFTGEAIRSLARELRPIARFTVVTVQLYDRGSKEFRRCTSGPRCDLPADIRTEETGAWWVYTYQRPLVIPRMDQETRFRRVIDALRGCGIQSTYLVPLTTAHGRLGSASFSSDLPEILSNEEIELLAAIANPLALAVESWLRQGSLRDFDGTGRMIVTSIPGTNGEPTTPSAQEPTPNIRSSLQEVEREQIVRALRQTGWIVSGPKGAAACLGMRRSTLQFRMRKLGIPTRPH